MSPAKANVPRGRIRRIAIVMHRYVGLSLVVFLVVAGLTGSLLAFNESLDAAISPRLFRVAEGAQPMDPFEVTRRVDDIDPARFRVVHFSPKPGHSSVSWVQEEEGVWRQWFVNPNTGELLGKRTWGDIGEGTKNLMPFLYRLHYSLGLDLVGTVIFGIAAVLWTLDCFVGAYLTFPQSTSRRDTPWLSRWGRSWRLQFRSVFSGVFSGHRAGGLWLWGLLLVFAWSAVGLNLPPVQRAVTQLLMPMEVIGHEALPHLTPPYPEPKLSLREARTLGREAMAKEARARNFEVLEELQLYYADDHGAFGYVVRSTLDISDDRPWTEVYLDGQTGEFLGFYAPTGITAGNTFSSWLTALHTASVFGWGYRVVVALLGLLVAFLSVSGVWIWWRKFSKRRGRARDKRTRAVAGPKRRPAAVALPE